MKHLPNLSPAVRRAAFGLRARPQRAVSASQLESAAARSSIPGTSGLPPSLLAAASQAAAAFPVYGKYCGPGHGDGSGCSPADDDVDAVCCRHDQCYGREGEFDCGCDCDLVAAMPGAIARSPSAEGRAKGALILELFRLSPCVCRIGPGPLPNPGGPTKCAVCPG
jgi:hypothetical protein